MVYNTHSTDSSSPPIVDLTSFHSSPDLKLRCAKDLVSACHEYGFVYIKGHGVPPNKLSEAFTVSKKFYSLSQSEKMKAPHPPGWSVHRGYSWPGLEKVSNETTSQDISTDHLREVQDYKESYEIGSEQNSDQPNVWLPDDVLPEWKSVMTEFYWTCWNAAQTILRALALGLELDEEMFLKLHSGHYNQLRLLHYPPIAAGDVEDGKFARLPAHTDWSTITILFQDDCGGLQVETKDGSFVDVAPVPDTLVLNIGDLMMRWTNGEFKSDLSPGDRLKPNLLTMVDYLKSTQHRVQLPPLQDRYEGGERLTRARYSIPYFVTTDPDTVVECFALKDAGKPKYEPITQRDYAAVRARMQY